ncbi:MAG TPA: choice-of-anchor tandem repeat GloVer-containing protein [Methylocella sp.]|nr:choice-of-anchor tandem repeat GloVer-containing protein [Methylocella sp.]
MLIAGILLIFIAGSSASATRAEEAASVNAAPPGQPPALSPFTTIYRFQGGALGLSPKGGLAADAEGNLYGTALYGGKCTGCGVVFKLAKPVPGKTQWIYSVLHAFQPGRDEIAPAAPLTIKGGTIYGTAAGGCANQICSYGGVFRLTKSGSSWTYKLLHRFNKAQGSTPLGGVLVASNGTLYGTTFGGGRGNAGVIYKIAPNGQFSVIHNFTRSSPGGGPCKDCGNYPGGPQGELIFGKDGAIYGTTARGGKYDLGTVFRVTPAGAHSILYSFLGSNQLGGSHDGAQPEGRLALGKNGTIYGTTSIGGKSPTGYGTAWSLAPKGGGKWAYMQILIFDGAVNTPHSGVVIDASGNLYGAGEDGGTYSGGGLFRLSLPKTGSAWILTVLRNFNPLDANGTSPAAGLTLSGGMLYGLNTKGGLKTGICFTGCGTAFAYRL